MNNFISIATKTRHNVLDTVYNAGSGHIDSSFSIIEILVILYYKFLNLTPEHPNEKKRDYLILSKGHAVPAQYAILADKGFFPKNELNNLRNIGALLQGHPKSSIPGIDSTTGSLGQGLSIACGIAYANQYIHKQKNKTYVILGDGELNEGQIWEALMFASHQKLFSLTIIVDCNKLQYTGETKNILNLNPLKDKFEAFGFETFSINGHSFIELDTTLTHCISSKTPNVILANTVKGKGVSFMENNLIWHGKVPNKELYEQAKTELGDYNA